MNDIPNIYDASNIILILRYEAVKRRIHQILDWPLSHPETYEKLGIKPPAGLLLHGPSGKTFINFDELISP